jgi:cell division protein FtsL
MSTNLQLLICLFIHQQAVQIADLQRIVSQQGREISELKTQLKENTCKKPKGRITKADAKKLGRFERVLYRVVDWLSLILGLFKALQA